MSTFNWNTATTNMADFGGREKTLRVPKTGLPFFDVLRLYGAIEMYLGISGDVFIEDAGHEWRARGKVREQRLKNQEDVAAALEGGPPTKKKAGTVSELALAIEGGAWPTTETRNVSTPLENPDSALKDGVRDNAARRYTGLETGQGEKSKVPFADALLAYAGQERVQVVAGIYFLPVFKGKVDYATVISPLRAWVSVPNVLCAQVLALLALKTSLFAEGYADRLSAVVYNTNLDGRKNFNYSGLIQINSTALGRDRRDQPRINPRFYGHCYRIFRALVARAWQNGKSTSETEDALAYAYWLMQPERPQNLSTLITAVERQNRNNRPHLLVEQQRGERPTFYAKEIFQMSYGNWDGDHEAVRKLARAVASGIYEARQKKEAKREDQGKAWYDEVTMLRSAPTAKAFFERALILIEQGHRANHFIGTARNQEDFDPAPLMRSVGNSRHDFETFRDLFRMYLVQESTPRSRAASVTGAEPVVDVAIQDVIEEGEL